MKVSATLTFIGEFPLGAFTEEIEIAPTKQISKGGLYMHKPPLISDIDRWEYNLTIQDAEDSSIKEVLDDMNDVFSHKVDIINKFMQEGKMSANLMLLVHVALDETIPDIHISSDVMRNLLRIKADFSFGVIYI